MDRQTGVLHVADGPRAPALPRLRFITHDVMGVERTGSHAVAGPFAELKSGRFRICPASASAPDGAKAAETIRKPD